MIGMHELPVVAFPVDQALSGAVADYCQCYRLNQNTRALCEAIIMAVDYCELAASSPSLSLSHTLTHTHAHKKARNERKYWKEKERP